VSSYRDHIERPLSAFNEHVVIWLPALLGGLFPVIVRLEHWLYSRSVIGARAAIGFEAVYFLLCVWAMAVAVVLGIRLLKGGSPKRAFWVVVSVLACLGLLGAGIESGAAIVYAT